MGSNAVADDNDLDVSAQLACQRNQAAASERLVVWMRSDDHDAASPEDLIQIGYGGVRWRLRRIRRVSASLRLRPLVRALATARGRGQHDHGRRFCVATH